MKIVIKMKILVTGSEGFIGKHLCRELKRRKIKFTICDLKNACDVTKTTITSYENFDCVVHLAAELSNDAIKCHKNNILATQKLVEFCKWKGIPLIFTSSCAIYGEGNYPKNNYGFSKLIAEEYVKTLPHYTILRLSNVYGEGGKGVINKFIESMQKNESLILKDSMRDFIHIKDVVKMIMLQLKKKQKKIYNVSTGRSVFVGDTIGIIQKHFPNSWVDIFAKSLNEDEIKVSSPKSDLPFKPIKLERGIKLCL